MNLVFAKSLRVCFCFLSVFLLINTHANAYQQPSAADDIAKASDYLKFKGQSYGWITERSSPSQARAWGRLADNYQHVYAQLWVKPFSPVQAQVPCKGSFDRNGNVRRGRGSFWGNFLGIFGVRQDGFATILITVKNQLGEELVSNIPVVTFVKKGDTCQRQIFEGPISPKILRRAGDRLNVEYKMVHKTTDRTSLLGPGSLLSTVASVSEVFTAGMSNGLVSDLTKFAANQSAAPAIEAFLGTFLNENTTLSGNRNLFFGRDEADDLQPTDSLFMAIGEPIFNGSLVSVADARKHIDKDSVVQLSIDTVYYATIFGTCRIFNEQFTEQNVENNEIDLEIDPSKIEAIEKGCTSFDNPQVILGREFDGTELRYAHTMVPAPATENPVLTGLSSRLEALKPRLNHRRRSERREAIQELESVCDLLRSSTYVPTSLLNKLDNTLLRYAVLNDSLNYGDDADVRSLRCINKNELELLKIVASKNSDYVVAEQEPGAAFAWSALAIEASKILRTPRRRNDRYADNIVVEIEEPFLRRDLMHSLDIDKDGSIDSPGLPDLLDGKEQVQDVLIRSLHLDEGPYCPIDAKTGGQTDFSKIGFLQNIVEKVDPQNKRIRGVGIIAEFDSPLNTNPEAKIEAIRITSWEKMLEKMGHNLSSCAEPSEEERRKKYSGKTVDW